MKKLILLFAVLVFIHLGAYSQNCLTVGITFETQSQVDSFKINYPGCTRIMGDLNISGLYITHLNGLNMLTSIGGDLNIKIFWSDSYLNNLTGLDNLLIIDDFTGREVKTLVDSEKTMGEHSVKFEASGLPSGVYFYQLQANEKVETKKMIVYQ